MCCSWRASALQRIRLDEGPGRSWMFLLTVIGLARLDPALGAQDLDIDVWIEKGSFKLSNWGLLWYALDPSSLNIYQAPLERYVSPVVSDEVLAPMLFWPAVFVFLRAGPDPGLPAADAEASPARATRRSASGSRAEISRRLILRAAMKADCGISTVAELAHALLAGFFCFSSSLRLR